MFRINSDTAVASDPGYDAPANAARYWSQGDPDAGQPATAPGPYWFQMMDDEMQAVLTEGSITPALETHTQLRDAIKNIAAAAIASGTVVNLPMNRVRPQFVDADTVRIPDGFQCADSTGAYSLTISGNQDVSIASAGAVNKLDTGTRGNNTFYRLHVIGDSTATNPTRGLLSLSRTAPTLPSGYDIFRPIPVPWLTDGSGDIKNQEVIDGFPWTPRVVYQDDLEPFTDSSNRVLNGGSATTPTVVDCSGFVPPEAEAAIIQVAQKNENLNHYWGKTSSTSDRIRFNDDDETRLAKTVPLNTSQQFYYALSSAVASYYAVQGYIVNTEFDA